MMVPEHRIHPLSRCGDPGRCSAGQRGPCPPPTQAHPWRSASGEEGSQSGWPRGSHRGGGGAQLDFSEQNPYLRSGTPCTPPSQRRRPARPGCPPHPYLGRPVPCALGALAGCRAARRGSRGARVGDAGLPGPARRAAARLRLSQRPGGAGVPGPAAERGL